MLNDYTENKWVLMLIGFLMLVGLGFILWFVFFSDTIVAEAKQEDKVYWCHTEPNGNFQTLHLPLQALQNAGIIGSTN